MKREKERRERGRNLGEVQEERDRMLKKLELDKQKKEKNVSVIYYIAVLYFSNCAILILYMQLY